MQLKGRRNSQFGESGKIVKVDTQSLQELIVTKIPTFSETIKRKLLHFLVEVVGRYN